MAIVQTGLFGQDYAVNPDCSNCERLISGEVYKGLDCEALCINCFEDADLATCPECEKVIGRDDFVKNPDGDEWCVDCIDARCSECNTCYSLVLNNDCVEVRSSRNRYGHHNTDTLCESCADGDTIVCTDCDTRVYSGDAVRTSHGDDICDHCYSINYITCEECNEVVHHDLSHCTDNGCYCDDCGYTDGYDFSPAGFRNRSGRITEIGSARCFGIELETDECDGYNALEDVSAWGAKDDCTVNGKEFYSDILNGDDGLVAIKEWGECAERNRWRAGRNAGYHLHLDMRTESDDSLYAIAYAYRKTENVWLSFVSGDRSRNSYCHPCRWSCDDVDRAVRDGCSFSSFVDGTSRTTWCNLGAYHSHETIEIRLHEGTCDSTAVINWVKTHTRFCDWAAQLGYEGVKEALANLDCDDMFRLLIREVWMDYPLSEYYAQRARDHAQGYLTESVSLENCNA
jgi:hypothetical protein